MTLVLPREAEGLTAEWLTQAFQQRYPGAVVTEVRRRRTIGGTGTKIQLQLEYNPAGIEAGLPTSIFAKGGFEWHQAAFAASYIAEAIFYADWAPGIPARIPRSYFAGHDEGQGIVLIEDLGLAGVRFPQVSREPLDAGTVAQVLRLLASVLAATWNQARLGTLRTLGQRVGMNFIDHFLAPDYYASALARPKGAFIPKELHDPTKMLALLKANWAQAETGPQSFCHGDAHMGNLFFEQDGSLGLLDFQAYVRSSPLHDICYHVVGSLSPAERRHHERELLRAYLAELAAQGGTDVWQEDEAWLRFRKHTAHGLLWFASPEEMQPAAIVEAHAERFGGAADEYGIVKLLKIT